MASLKLQRNDGTTESFELSRSQPVTIGRQPFNDICIPDSDIGSMHCRVRWNKTGFEVTAATADGVEVNSTNVAHLTLKSGDVIRLGESHLVYEEQLAAKVPPPPPPPPVVPRKRDKRPVVVEKPVDESSLFDGPVLTESQAAIDALFDDEKLADSPLPGSKPKPQVSNNPFDRPPVRPGEQEILKSPLVLTLAGGGLALLLITGIFWFLMSREQSNRMYDRAVAEMNAGQYSQSISTFEKFIEKNPKHGLRRQAERGLAKAQIQKEISGAAPSWKRGLERLNDLIKTHRNDSDFSTLHSSLFQYAEQISLGAAKSAETSHRSRSARSVPGRPESAGALFGPGGPPHWFGRPNR